MTQAKLRNRIKVLEEDLSSKTEALQKYEVMGNNADEKIQALNKIHNDKIRSLMNSIQMLKKDNAQLLNQGKQHKRSQLIAALNKQISDQDIVIEVIRNYVYKQHGKEQGRAALDGIIVAALTKGPERIRAPTRQELKIEIENLKVRIQNMKSGNVKVGALEQKVISNQSDISNLTIENDREQLFQTLQNLKTSNEKLQIELKSTNKTIETMKTQLIQHSKLDIEATSLRTDIAIANKKIETLQTILKQTKQYNNTKIIQLYQRQIKVQELQMQSKNNGNKLNLLQQSHSIALQELNLQIQRLKAELDSLIKQNQRMILQNIGMKKTHDNQKGKIQQIRELNIKQKTELGQKLQKYEKQFERLVYDNDQKNQKIINLTEQLNKLKLQMTNLQLQLQELNQNGVTNQNFLALLQKNNQLQQEIQRLKELGGDGEGYVPSSLLMDRIRTLQKRIAILQKQLRDNNILSDKQIQALHDQNLFEKYLQLAKQFEKFKLQHKNSKSKKNIHLIQLDEQERQKLKKLDTSLSQLGLRSVQSNAIRDYDSDFEFQIINKKKKPNGLPVISEYDKELMGLITSDLWDFLYEDKVGQMLEQLSDYQSQSKYYQSDEIEIQIEQSENENLLALQRLGKNMKKGERIKVHAQQYNKLINLNSDVSDVKSMRQKDLQKAYNSDIQLEPLQLNLHSIVNKTQQPLNLASHELIRINNLSSNISSSIMDASVSEPRSGQSNINVNTLLKNKRQMKSTNINSKTHKKQLNMLRTTQLDRFKNYNSDVSDIQAFRQNQLQVYDSNIRLQQSELPLQSDNDYATNQNISSNSSDTYKPIQIKPHRTFKKNQQSKQNRYKQKTSMLIGLHDLESKNSDYEQPEVLRAKLGLNGSLNSSVSSNNQIDNKALKIINSDISIGSFKKKR